MMESSLDQYEPSNPSEILPDDEEWPFFSNIDDGNGKNGMTPIAKRLDRRCKKATSHVLLEGYVGVTSKEQEPAVVRTKSLTDEDLDELKGCLDLGFGFSYDEIPELCNTLPALELCYSMTRRFHDEQQQGRSFEVARDSGMSSPIASWKISSPGDHPEDVKARLKFWAQAVACTVRLCS